MAKKPMTAGYYIIYKPVLIPLPPPFYYMVLYHNTVPYPARARDINLFGKSAVLPLLMYAQL